MLIDTHCHLDDPVFSDDRQQVVQRACAVQVKAIVIPAVEASSFDRTIQCAHRFPHTYYALGIHPMYVPQAKEHDIKILENYIKKHRNDPRFVALGEIGLDFFVPELRTTIMHKKQVWFYIEQLRLAQRYELPVLLHVRRSQDLILKYARRFTKVKGIAHAFNGSFQQAERFLDFGFRLGMGGAMTFQRAKQIRRLVSQLPLASFVLETDAPDIPPAWLNTSGGKKVRNEPFHLAQIAECFAHLRGLTTQEAIQATGQNALEILPKLAKDLSH